MEIDEDQILKRDPNTFLQLVQSHPIPPSKFHLDTTLPSKATLVKSLDWGKFPPRYYTEEQVKAFLDGLQQDEHEPGRIPERCDLAVRLVIAIFEHNWNFVHFLFEHCEFKVNSSIVQTPGMEFLRPVFSAICLLSPRSIGPRGYHCVLTKWVDRNERDCNLDLARTPGLRICRPISLSKS